MTDINRQVEDLDLRVAQFAYEMDLPIQLFQSPESVRVRTLGTASFTALETYYAQKAEKMAVAQHAWRFHAVAKLQSRFILPNFGQVNWLEIDEPTERQVEAGHVGVVSLRFIYPDLEKISTILKARQVSASRTEEEVVAHLTGGFQTVEFSDADADTVLEWQLARGEAVEVRL